MNQSALTQVLILLAVAVLFVAAFRRFRLPPILGYLLVGIVAGPHALGWVGHSESVHVVAELGVVLLLFSIGLEFSIPQFMAMRRTLLGLGGMQVLVGTLTGGGIAWLLGIPWQTALVVGGALSMSSTAIVIKQLTDQLELQSQPGRLALGILLFQDLAAVPFLVMIPILAAGGDGGIGLPLFYALLKGLLAFAIMLALGRWVLRPLFHEVAGSRSAELFTLTVLLVSLAAAWVTSLLGLSLALGAFLAGMMLSETEYRHQVETEIRPFRDVLLGLFFVTVGMQLDLALLPPLWPWVTLLVLGLVVGKGALIVLLTLATRYEPAVAIRTGTILCHGGEFGIALLALAMANGLLSTQDSQAILAAIVISMALAPVLIRHNVAFSERIVAKPPPSESVRQGQDLANALHGPSGHVIICGFGRVGQNMAGILMDEGFQYVALDLDPVRVRGAWEAGQPVFYANAIHREILDAAGLRDAAALLVSFDEAESALKILQVVRSVREDLPVLVSTRDASHLDQLIEAGATEVVPETLEASLTLGIQLLVALGVPWERVLQDIEAVRGDRYRLLQVLFHKAASARSEGATREKPHTVLLPAGAFAVGRSLEELDLESIGVLVMGIHRGQAASLEIVRPDLQLESGDRLILKGTVEHVEAAERRLLIGQRSRVS